MKTFKIGLMGSGKVAFHLCKALQEKNHHIEWVFSRNLKHAAVLGEKYNLPFTNSYADLNPEVDFILLAIKDDAIEVVLKKIEENVDFHGIIAHTSGSVSSAISKPFFKKHGVFYPLQTFSKEVDVLFEDIPICITGNSNSTLKKLNQLAGSLSNCVQEIGDQQRFVLHISAVFSCNFANHMFRIAEYILAEHNLPFHLLRPLIAETSKKIDSKLPSESQTGPAIRNDLNTIEDHLKFLEKYPNWRTLYKKISEDIPR